ncbi:U7 snRNA-associated Sm-like protein LSm10 [Exaiptasia diaphana]|uniref:Sm domain-containing protein n=1 Tax=Exaiptasia diaphana TaxID=2652724 RepID=A0A913XQR5_EXADI|nr:U7 snRNA-associated Sm-like protein LSm10 [Exaiptasia diaphana]
MAAGKERAVIERSLVCLLTSLHGYKTTIELRNEDYIEGTIDHVDGFMNITISDAKFVTNSGEEFHYSKMVLVGEKIRYVHIPDEIDMRQAIEQKLTSIENSRNRKSERRKGGKRRQNMLKS